jgi:hypothetical protein
VNLLIASGAAEAEAAATIKLMEANLLLIPWVVIVSRAQIPLFRFSIHPFAGREQP